MTVEQIKEVLMSRKDRSAWSRGVTGYAIDLLDNLDGVVPESFSEFSKKLLNGADNWRHYSYSGCALCYDGDIAEALCTPSELKRTHNGEHMPNADETWLDVQARALCQAAHRVCAAYTKLKCA